MSELNLDAMQRPALETTAGELGVKFAANAGDDTLRKKIREHLGEPESDIKPATSAEPTPSQRFEIIIATHDRDHQPVQVGINGKMYVITRGEKVIVPRAVVKALESAVRYEYDPKTMKRTDVLSYPFQVVREIEA
jgi:hypothetical protein